MFRKIRSNLTPPSPAAAVLLAFGSRLGPLLLRFRMLCQQHPKKIFSLMVLLMATSMVLCFSVMRTAPRSGQKTAAPVYKKLGAAPAGIGLTIDKLQRVMALQAELQAMAAKQSLTAADSVRFTIMLNEIRALTSNQK